MLSALWASASPLSPGDVQKALGGDLAYTTVMTMMKILEQKRYLKKNQEDRAHVYKAAQPKRQVIGDMVRDFVNRVFNGSAEPLREVWFALRANVRSVLEGVTLEAIAEDRLPKRVANLAQKDDARLRR